MLVLHPGSADSDIPSNVRWNHRSNHADHAVDAVDLTVGRMAKVHRRALWAEPEISTLVGHLMVRSHSSIVGPTKETTCRWSGDMVMWCVRGPQVKHGRLAGMIQMDRKRPVRAQLSMQRQARHRLILGFRCHSAKNCCLTCGDAGGRDAATDRRRPPDRGDCGRHHCRGRGSARRTRSWR